MLQERNRTKRLQDWEGRARSTTTTTSATNAAATNTDHHQQPPSPPAAYHSPSTSSTRATTTTAADSTTTTTAPSHSTTTAPPQQHHSTTSQQRRPLRQLLLPGFPCLVSERAGVPAVLPRPPGTCGACSARRARPKAPRLTQMRPVGGPCRRAPSSIAAHTWPRRSQKFDMLRMLPAAAKAPGCKPSLPACASIDCRSGFVPIHRCTTAPRHRSGPAPLLPSFV